MILKKPYNDKDYFEFINYCNNNGLLVDDKGDYLESVAVVITLEKLKAHKINEFKTIRDNEEAKPIVYNGNLFDFDDKARDRINSAIIALSITGQSIEWTTADNTNVLVTADDLRNIIANVAVRSNALHTAYRAAKEKVEVATTKAEIDAINF
ncbi:DUF4376 domain-containing protein [Phascolarctobacterium succinatutens]|uniref:DUF4376 domain-containing protein n=1 Tax=Phascolarctobacterium succinatutens TaxID=626940 RepID=UPI0023FA472D|nr:DUF4376 domain-containing protein [Phascolarctobacterium succinatutens]